MTEDRPLRFGDIATIIVKGKPTQCVVLGMSTALTGQYRLMSPHGSLYYRLLTDGITRDSAVIYDHELRGTVRKLHKGDVSTVSVISIKALFEALGVESP